MSSNIKNLPVLFNDKGFKDFDAYNDFLKGTKEFCIRFYKGETEKNSLVFCGNVGNGKTHLAIAILRNLIPIEGKLGLRPQNARFMVADEFFMRLTDAAFEKKSKLNLIKEWMNDDVFCLDDLGTYNMTSAKIENLYTFINYAYLGARRIIVTTNFLMRDFDQYDKRISSRLNEMAHIVPFMEKDFRKK